MCVDHFDMPVKLPPKLKHKVVGWGPGQRPPKVGQALQIFNSQLSY